ncbi:MipA/OmpV family protein [Ramlibacter sp.]|uniref:MipA/OmpV family protein n=1 Tax=Ramlibacter sp. TaxID=1917967 RepID=UPI0017D7D787|nr:MipA/OmpV family protein [Ramlibacter sp.]MBA2672934.1 MipA/OmpV family protein [Ramlibacter sp.]
MIPQRLRPVHFLRLGTLALACALPLGAFAELSNTPLLGLGLRSAPGYDGSETQRVEIVPVIRYLGAPLFVRSTQGVLEGGVRTELMPGLNVGAQIAYEPGRLSSHSDFLRARNAADIDRGASVGVHLEWDTKLGPVPLSFLTRARRNIDADLGTQVDFRLSAGAFQSGRFSAGVFGQAVWADTKSTQAYYGVDAQQAAATHLPAYQAGSGLLNTSFGVLWSVDLAPKWVVVGSVERRQLRGDAARSPFAQRSSNNYVSAGLAYRL